MPPGYRRDAHVVGHFLHLQTKTFPFTKDPNQKDAHTGMAMPGLVYIDGIRSFLEKYLEISPANPEVGSASQVYFIDYLCKKGEYSAALSRVNALLRACEDLTPTLSDKLSQAHSASPSDRDSDANSDTLSLTDAIDNSSETKYKQILRVLNASAAIIVTSRISSCSTSHTPFSPDSVLFYENLLKEIQPLEDAALQTVRRLHAIDHRMTKQMKPTVDAVVGEGRIIHLCTHPHPCTCTCTSTTHPLTHPHARAITHAHTF